MDPRRFPGGEMFVDDTQASCSGNVAGSSDGFQQLPFASADPRIPLYNLSILRQKMASVRQFISQSLDQNVVMGKDQMNLVSTEISSAIHQIIVNGAALLACSSQNNLGSQFAAGSVLVAGKVPDHGDLKAQTSAQFIGRVTAPSEMMAGKTPTSSLPVDLTTQTSYSIFQSSMESSDLHGFESNSIYGRTPNKSDLESLLTSLDSNKQEIGVPKIGVNVEQKIKDEIVDADCEIVELDAVELLAEHIHYCEICGKGFKRDANLRMHMRAHGNQFKTPEALAKPERCAELGHKIRFSCPFAGCNRNKSHKKFRSLKSAICVKNHFKRSHCPKMFSCNRCNKKSFSVLADLRSHLKHCGESKWRCTCGTTFSRKDKLFGHMALFEGHMPDVAERDEISKGAIIMEEDEVEVEDEEEETQLEEGISGLNGSDNEFFNGLLEGFGSIDADYWKDVL